MTEEEKDIEFLQKYKLLCKEHNRCIDIVDYDEVGVTRKEYSNYSFLMPEEREKIIYENNQKREKEINDQKEKLRKQKEDYVNSGGALDIHGEVPNPVPKNYCQLIDVSYENTPITYSTTIRWGKTAMEFFKTTDAVIRTITSGSYSSQEIQDLLSKEGFDRSIVKEIITELWEQGKINFDEDFRIKLIDNGS